MKYRFSLQHFVFFILFTSLIACKKKEIINIYEPFACFSAKSPSYYLSSMYQGYVVQMDSTFRFTNCSDTGDNVTYHWDFGDGTTSDEKNPMHKYARRGSYRVTLGVSVQDKAYDTAQKTVWSILGEKNIQFGHGYHTVPVTIEETAGNEFVLLVTTTLDGKYSLLQLDSLLNQKSIKTFPAGYRLYAMQPTTDGNYIFTGTTQGAGQNNELIKIKADGTLIWNKTITAGDSYTYAAQTPDGGYTAIGTRPLPIGPYGTNKYITVVSKTDNNGNLQWQKLFDKELLITSRDAVIEQNGIVLAGVTQYSGYCSTCDTLLITKLDYSGNTIWKNTMLWSLNNYDWAGTHVTKLTNGNYGVYNDTTKAIYYFTASGNFVDRIVAQEKVLGIANTADGNLIALQQQNGYLGITKLTLDGYQQWNRMVDGSTGGSSAVAIRPLRNGGSIALGIRYTQGYPQFKYILLLEMDDTGKMK
jgi:PKD repeat protein